MTSGDHIRLAILGCGAVTELGHLPAIAKVADARVTTLIDTNAARRERLAAAFGVEHTAADIDGCLNRFDAAVIALPHALHAPASIQLLKNGKSVLVEKPMALTAAECDAMIEAADAARAVLAVGLVRRFLHANQLARALIAQGFLGKIEAFDFREGNIYNWPVASDFFFRREPPGAAFSSTPALTRWTLSSTCWAILPRSNTSTTPKGASTPTVCSICGSRTGRRVLWN